MAVPATQLATLASLALNLTWDFGNQLSGVDTNGTPASQEVTFRYDVLGRRVGRVEGGSSIVFVQAGQQTIADYDAGQIPGKPNHVYVYGSYIDEPIARRESGSLAYFHRNQQYSIVAISNSSGAVIERYSYTAHGQLSIYNAAGTVLSVSAFDNRFTYTGREWDATLALHYFRARWYDPLAGRFISRDPLGYVDGMSFYMAYFAVDTVDPIGMERLGPRSPLDELYPNFVLNAYGAPCEDNCDFAADICRDCRLNRRFLWSASDERAQCEAFRTACKDLCRAQQVLEEGPWGAMDPTGPTFIHDVVPQLGIAAGGAIVTISSKKISHRAIRVGGRAIGSAVTLFGLWDAAISVRGMLRSYRHALVSRLRNPSERFGDNKKYWDTGDCKGNVFGGVFFPGFLDPNRATERGGVVENAHGFWLEPCHQPISEPNTAIRKVRIYAYGYFGGEGWQHGEFDIDVDDLRARRCFTWDELLRIEARMNCMNYRAQTVAPKRQR